jgi:hypothetical protein
VLGLQAAVVDKVVDRPDDDAPSSPPSTNGGAYSRSLISHYQRAQHSVPSEDDVYDSSYASHLLASVKEKEARAREDLLTGASQIARFNQPPQTAAALAGTSPNRRVVTGQMGGHRQTHRGHASSDDVLMSSPSHQRGVAGRRLEALVEGHSPGSPESRGGHGSHTSEGVDEVREAIRRMEAARVADAKALDELRSLCDDMEHRTSSSHARPNDMARGSPTSTATGPTAHRAPTGEPAQRHRPLYTQSTDSVASAQRRYTTDSVTVRFRSSLFLPET